MTLRRAAAALPVALLLAACVASPPAPEGATAPRTGRLSPPLVVGMGASREVAPVEAPDTGPEPAPLEVFESGGASWYGPRFNGRRTASGERFDVAQLTAAHRTLAFGTQVCVHSVATGRTVMVRVNDRGPHARQRVIDVSQAAADALGIRGLGVTQVTLSLPPQAEDAGCGPDAAG